MAYESLDTFINELRAQDELIEITAEVNSYLEITEIADREMKKPGGGKALLFSNNGTGFPVLVNAFGSEKRMLKALGAESFESIQLEIMGLFAQITGPKNSLGQKLKMLPMLGKVSSWMPRVKSGRGACQQVVQQEPDLSKLPVLYCWPYDGGPFITLPLVHTRDPEKGTRNVGMYRMQVFDKQTTGMHWHRHKTGAQHYRAYKAKGERMPVAVALGGDPVCTYAATAPLPDGIDEYMLAGYLRKKRVEMVKCITQDIAVPAEADIIIEGYVDTSEELRREGPFGDHTGFYSLADDFPVFHVTCITHRKNAVYPATIVGVPPMEDVWMAKATEELFKPMIQLSMLPEMIDMHMPDAGVAHNLAIVQINNDYPGQAQKIMHALWGAGQMMFNKVMVVVGPDCDIRDYHALAKYVFKRFIPDRDVLISSGPADELEHASDMPVYGGKLGIDATMIAADAADPPLQVNIPLDANILKVNNELLMMGIPVILLSMKGGAAMGVLERTAREHLQNFTGALVAVDARVELMDIFLAAWYVLGSMDPKRDCQLVENDKGGVLLIDGSNKKQSSGFRRDWPNVVAMDEETIELVDSKWDEYGIGDFVLSPSKRYHKMLSGKAAVYQPRLD